MRGDFFPKTWPEHFEQEQEFEQQLDEAYLDEDPRLASIIGGLSAPGTNIRVRVLKDMIGWVVFQQMGEDLVASGAVFLLWSYIASRHLTWWISLLCCFLAMQVVYGVPTFRFKRMSDRVLAVIQGIEAGMPITWPMVVGAMERTLSALYGLILQCCGAVLLTLVAVAILIWSRDWWIAVLVVSPLVVLTYLRLAGTVSSLGQNLAKGSSLPSKDEVVTRIAKANAALPLLGARLGRFFSVTARRPESDAHLRMPRQGLFLFLFSFDVEVGLAFMAALAYVVFRKAGVKDLRMSFLAVSAGLGWSVLALNSVQRRWKPTGFKAVILRRFSLKSDLVARRTVGPILAAAGHADVVVLREQAATDAGPMGALVSKGLQRSGIERLIDFEVQQTWSNPMNWGAHILPRGTFGSARTLTFSDEEWPRRVEELLRQCDAAVVDVTDLSDSVRYEVESALKSLPPSRIFFLAEHGGFQKLEEAIDSEELSLSDLPNLIPYKRGWPGMMSLRWRFYRAVRNMT